MPYHLTARDRDRLLTQHGPSSPRCFPHLRHYAKGHKCDGPPWCKTCDEEWPCFVARVALAPSQADLLAGS